MKKTLLKIRDYVLQIGIFITGFRYLIPLLKTSITQLTIPQNNLTYGIFIALTFVAILISIGFFFWLCDLWGTFEKNNYHVFIYIFLIIIQHFFFTKTLISSTRYSELVSAVVDTILVILLTVHYLGEVRFKKTYGHRRYSN